MIMYTYKQALVATSGQTLRLVKDTLKLCAHTISRSYGVASISRLLKIIGLFCKKAL